MNPVFEALLDRLAPKFDALVSGRPITGKHELPRCKLPGVYLFSEGSKHLYVGRTNDIRGRYSRHCNPGATHRMAAFAFKLAREETGFLKASYKQGDLSRSGLMQNPKFSAAFSDAKARIREMRFRFVEEADPLRQCLLEIYCSVCLTTPYNDFDNH